MFHNFSNIDLILTLVLNLYAPFVRLRCHFHFSVMLGKIMGTDRFLNTQLNMPSFGNVCF